MAQSSSEWVTVDESGSDPGTEKESNQTISPKNKSCRRKTREVYQNAVWLMFLHKNSFLYVFFSLL